MSGATWRQKPALWNEARDGVGRYQAPAGYVIKSAVPRVQSEARSSSQVNISADKREQWVQCVAHRASPQVRFTKDRLMCLNPGWYVVIYTTRGMQSTPDCDRRPVRPGSNPNVRVDLGDCPETTRSMQGAFR